MLVFKRCLCFCVCVGVCVFLNVVISVSHLFQQERSE